MKKIIIFILLISILLNIILAFNYLLLRHTKEPEYPYGKWGRKDEEFFETANFDIHPTVYDIDVEIAQLKIWTQDIIENGGEISEDTKNYMSVLEEIQECIRTTFQRWEQEDPEKNFRITAVKIYSNKAIIDFDSGLTFYRHGDIVRMHSPGHNPNKLFLKYQDDKWVVVDFFHLLDFTFALITDDW